MMLLGLRLTGTVNTVKRYPLRYLVVVAFLGLVYWGIFRATRWAVRFLDSYPSIGTIAEAVTQRSLEALFIILMFGVAFSVLTTAITTLYSSDDLPFLLSLPVAPAQVFGLKTLETFLNAALLPTLFTLPVLVGLGLERTAPLTYYGLSLAVVLALFALPVAVGALLALVLVRLAPAGRVKELATAVSVLLAAGMILGLRALRPEQLTALSPEEFEGLLGRFASFQLNWLPPNWASQAVLRGLAGEVAPAAYLLLAVALGLLGMVAGLSAKAYREGWIRSLDAGSPRADGRFRKPAWWEVALYRLGRGGSVVAKDQRLLMRDPTQWSQLLVLVALAGVYLVSVSSMDVQLQQFKNALGALNLMFLSFVLAGVGVWVAYPLVSLEKEGFWILRTGPLRTAQIVLAKFMSALPVMIVFGVGMGYAAARFIDVSSTLAFVSPIAGLSAAVVMTALGVGLGAAFPRFDATNAAEIPMSVGGLIYMTLSLLYATIMTVLLALPAWRTLMQPGSFYWREPEGQLLLGLLLFITLLVSALALWFGTVRLSRYEPGQ